jgi:uncharacterized protein (TIGR03032 family)
MDESEEVTPSPYFAQWLAEERLSLAVTAYHSGYFFMIGVHGAAQLSIRRRTFDHCMGLAGDGTTLWMSTHYQLWRLENALDLGTTFADHDRLYIPRMAYTTGAIDIHDVALDGAGRPVIVATRFNCIARPSETHSFRPIWKPPFISKLIDGDCCHLNGLAMSNGSLGYATAVSTTDSVGGWRERRVDGGVLIDIATNDVILDGLSMPHSPRFVDGELYLADSGTGRFGRVDTKQGRFEDITFCPGFIRGMAIHPPFAVVGISRLRHDNLSGLKLDGELERRNLKARSGILVIDLRTGNIIHSLFLEGKVHELYDIVVLPDVARPMALGLITDEIRQTITQDVSE